MTQDISAGRRILVLEDDETLRLVISRALTRAGFDVRATASPSSAIERMARRDADLLVADVLLGDENFLDRLEELQHVRPDAPVLVISAQTTAATAIQAVRGGAYEYWPKPFDLDEIDTLLKELEQKQDEATNAALPAFTLNMEEEEPKTAEPAKPAFDKFVRPALSAQSS